MNLIKLINFTARTFGYVSTQGMCKEIRPGETNIVSSVVLNGMLVIDGIPVRSGELPQSLTSVEIVVEKLAVGGRNTLQVVPDAALPYMSEVLTLRGFTA